MTAYVESPYCKTKKILKEHIGKKVTIITPNLVSEWSTSGHPVSGIAIVGPGPYERKWYAQIWTDGDGVLLKVK